METKKRAYMPAGMAIALFISLALAILCPQEALAKVNPWGSGTTYNQNTNTLTVGFGKRTIKSLRKAYKGKIYYVDNLVIKGGTTKLKLEYGFLKSLKVCKGKLASSGPINVFGAVRMTGGTVAISLSKRYSSALHVGDDLTVTGGKITVKTTKEGSDAISVSGDMRLKRGAVSVTTKGKSAGGLRVSGFLKVSSGTLKSVTYGKYSTAIRVSGDLIMSGGTINATSNRDEAIQCYDLLKVTGGTISAKAAPGKMAIYSGEPAIVKPGCLGTVSGGLSKGIQPIDSTTGTSV